MELSYNFMKLIDFMYFSPVCGLYSRSCPHSTQTQKQEECNLDQWEDNWTLVAVNHLGQHNLTDHAELSHRGTAKKKINKKNKNQ